MQPKTKYHLNFLSRKKWLSLFEETRSTQTARKVLLAYPRLPLTFWSMQFMLDDLLQGPKAAFVPLSLLTMAAFLPSNWQLRLVDENVEPIKDDDLKWADIIMASSMQDQIPSLDRLVSRAHALGRPVVVGGLDPSLRPHLYENIDYLHSGLVGDATFEMIKQLSNDASRPTKQVVWKVKETVHLEDYPLPRYDLIQNEDYMALSLQYAAGCPFSCEFCEVIRYLGQKPITKRPEQILAELDLVYQKGYRGNFFFVDDNFIGNIGHASEGLKAIADWQRRHGYPFQFFTEASLNLARRPDLMAGMKEAGFYAVFLGIETPDDDALKSVGKNQNIVQPLHESITEIQRNGLQIFGAFIVGLDDAHPNTHERIAAFIEKTDICVSLLSVLVAPEKTALYDRLARDGRIIFKNHKEERIYDSNVLFLGGQKAVFEEYLKLWNRVYEPKALFRRIARNIARTGGGSGRYSRLVSKTIGLKMLPRLLWKMGVRSNYRRHFWRAFATAIFRAKLPYFFYLALTAYHAIRFREHLLDNPPLPVDDHGMPEIPPEFKDNPLAPNYTRFKNGPLILD